MKEPKFSGAESLEHRPGQEGIVLDPVKAEVMAVNEDFYHEQAKLFEEYLSDPDAFDQKYPGARKSEHEDGSFSGHSPIAFEKYVQNGITPDDLRTIGNQIAEVYGVAHDFEKQVSPESTTKLRIESVLNFILAARYDIHGAIVEGTSGVSYSKKGNDLDAKRIEALLKMRIVDRELNARAHERIGYPENAKAIRERKY